MALTTLEGSICNSGTLTVNNSVIYGDYTISGSIHHAANVSGF